MKLNEDDAKTEVNISMVLAPFQKRTQVEFIDVKIKESAVRFLTVVNPHNKTIHVINFIHIYFALIC